MLYTTSTVPAYCHPEINPRAVQKGRSQLAVKQQPSATPAEERESGLPSHLLPPSLQALVQYESLMCVVGWRQ